MIVYKVDFTEAKKKGNVVYDKPAEIIDLKDCNAPYLKRACDYFNQGKLIQSLANLNKVLQNKYNVEENPVIPDNMHIMIGHIHFRLSNFDMAEINYIKSFLYKENLSILLMIYQNCICRKDFKFADKLKEFLIKNKNVYSSAIFNLSVIKKNDEVFFDEKFNIDRLLEQYISLKNAKVEDIGLNPLLEVLKIIDNENPYIWQLAKDAQNGVVRKYYKKLAKDMINQRFENTQLLIDNKLENASENDLLGYIRFLYENISYDKFENAISKICENKIVFKKFRAQMINSLYARHSENYKLCVLKHLLLNIEEGDITIFYKNTLFAIQSNDMRECIYNIMYIKQKNFKVANAFVMAVCNFIKIFNNHNVDKVAVVQNLNFYEQVSLVCKSLDQNYEILDFSEDILSNAFLTSFVNSQISQKNMKNFKENQELNVKCKDILKFFKLEKDNGRCDKSFFKILTTDED